jgi:hypothetical protein
VRSLTGARYRQCGGQSSDAAAHNQQRNARRFVENVNRGSL